MISPWISLGTIATWNAQSNTSSHLDSREELAGQSLRQGQAVHVHEGACRDISFAPAKIAISRILRILDLTALAQTAV